jgi:FkbM family methyltransferase
VTIDWRYRAWVLRALAARGETGLALRIAVLDLLIALGRGRGRDVRLPVRGGSVFLGSSTVRIDLETFLLMYVRGVFDADYLGHVVLDIGAHKGYYAARALGQGAAAVVCFEPESQNFAHLRMAQRAWQGGGRWEIRQQAVGGRAGRVQLYRSQESWSHSLYADLVVSPERGDVVSEEVEMVTLSSILTHVAAEHPNVPILLKVNVEGAAADVILGAPADELRVVSEVELDFEVGSHHSLEAVLDHLQTAGLTRVETSDEHNFHLTRPA